MRGMKKSTALAGAAAILFASLSSFASAEAWRITTDGSGLNCHIERADRPANPKTPTLLVLIPEGHKAACERAKKMKTDEAGKASKDKCPAFTLDSKDVCLRTFNIKLQ